jgi:hypothetical protein
MKKMIIGILIGFSLAILCFIPIVLKQRSGQFANGKHHGEIHGRFEVWRFLDKHFRKEERSQSKIKDSLPIKDADILVVEKNGVLTIETR